MSYLVANSTSLDSTMDRHAPHPIGKGHMCNEDLIKERKLLEISISEVLISFGHKRRSYPRRFLRLMRSS